MATDHQDPPSSAENQPPLLREAGTYAHGDQAVQRPAVGVQQEFPDRRPPKDYRYDSSLAPELCWDENAARDQDGVPAHYYPDFIAVLTTGLTLLIEIKGRYADDADLKAKAAQRWVAAVNRCGEYGTWRYLVITDPPKLMLELDQLTGGTPEAKELVLG